MKIGSILKRPALVALAICATMCIAQATTIPVTGWIVHNGTSTVGGTASNPTFTAGDNVTVMAPFDDVTLANDGDSVEIATTLTMNSRSSVGINSLNTQLRFGLFDDSVNATLTAGDAPNLGFIVEYTNAAAGGLIRVQTNAAQTAPFVSPVNIGNGVQDSGADSIQGANPGPVTFKLKLTRNSGLIDLSGNISGTDLVTMNPYLSTYSVSGYSSATFPADGAFTFNRVGLFLGDGVNAASASLENSTVEFVPEPASLLLVASVLAGSALMTRRSNSKRHSQRR